MTVQDTPQPAAARTTLPAVESGLHLFMPFYTPKDPERVMELRNCLACNMARTEFSGIYLLVDDDTRIAEDDPRLSVIRLDRRPSYLDWVRLSQIHCPGQVSVLANSDIYFDESISLLNEIFASDEKAFVALSRYDVVADQIVPHPNPHWSQDVWAFRPPARRDPLLEARIDVPLGVPRCDNKIAYLFSISGYRIYNPFKHIRTMHLHETGLRYYSKKGDRTLIGGMAMVRPSAELTDPAMLEVEIWSENTAQYAKLSVNKSLEKWTRQTAPVGSEPVIGHDADWQYPAVTEQHAYRMMKSYMGMFEAHQGVVYLGFPWATLIDLSVHAAKNSDRSKILREKLEHLRSRLTGCKTVITVCQHMRMLQFPDIFETLGITDIYWSHCTRGQTRFPGTQGIRLHPFPLYPVQCLAPAEVVPMARRRYLFSFIGAKSTPIYLTQIRQQILDVLKDAPGGKIVNRDTWHYNKIVYDKQILERADKGEALIDEDASEEFRRIMAESKFTLCPSGTGPNSIRLWESFANGSIPVVLSDSYLPPGNPGLWDLATVTCAENPRALADLPGRLSRLAADPAQMAVKERAGQHVMAKYGPDSFVYDVVAQMKAGAT